MNGGTRAETKKAATISIGNWIGTILLSLIPIVNVVSFIVWCIASRVPAKRNYGIAALIVSFILLLAYLAVIMFFADPMLAFLTDAASTIAGQP